MVERKDAEEIVARLKQHIGCEYRKGNNENVLDLVSVTASFLYSTNLYYADYDLENYIALTASRLNLSANIPSDAKFIDDCVLFYDGFGLNLRGLVQIYLKALCRIKKVLYVTYSCRRREIPDVLNILQEHNGKSFFLSGKTHTENIKQLNKIIQQERPKHFFFYAYPDDVTATAVMNAYNGFMKRYQINLTDHAFWLGAKPIDVCIDFRSYGANISHEYRKIPKNKIVIVPYYPIINYSTEFQGYPFDVSAGKRVVFSGGSLYKTLGRGNKYYKIVDYILSKYPDVIFWYAGSGNRGEMDKIISKHKGRAYLTPERSDLYQVIRHCYFYLSTYPVCGGLMYQYAAKAGKVPLTLYDDEMSDGILLNQSELGIMFRNIEDVFDEIDKLMNNEGYCNSKGEILEATVISEEDFNNEVILLFTDKAGKNYPVHYAEHTDTSSFRQIYLDNLTLKKLKNILMNKINIRNMMFFKYEPVIFLEAFMRKTAGIMRRVLGRLLRIMKLR